MSVGISVLAYGQKCIDETNNMIGRFRTLNIDVEFYVGTDFSNRIVSRPNVHRIELKGGFNYNLKRIPFSIAMRNHKSVFQLDSDVYLKNPIDLSILQRLEDGVYTGWMNLAHKDLQLQQPIEYSYLDKLNSLNKTGNPLYYTDDSVLLFNISDSITRFKIADGWNDLYNETLGLQPSYRNDGAVECLLIHLSCLNNGVSIYNSNSNPITNIIFENLFHYRDINNLNVYEKSFL